MELLFDNTTTIESLDRKRNPNNQYDVLFLIKFDMGNYFNWVQVMGKNKWLWPFPIYLNSGIIFNKVNQLEMGCFGLNPIM